MGIIFFWDDKWGGVSDVAPITEHVNFPAENTQHRDLNYPWRTRHGAGSTWGYFYIGTTNNKLYFKDSGSTARTATLTTGGYSAVSLTAEIKAEMEAVCTDTFTVDYIETGDDKLKFKITNNTGNFELTVSNDANAVFDTIGFNSGGGVSDLTGADNYTADYIRIHSTDFLKVNLGSSISIKAGICRGHNLQAGGTYTLQGHSSDTWGSPNISQSMSRNEKFIGKILVEASSQQWWRMVYVDKDNPDGYIEQGKIFLCPGFEPDNHFLSKSRVTNVVDQSIVKRSGGGQIGSIQEEDYEVWRYEFRVKGTTQINNWKDMFAAVKKSKPLFICEDTSNFPGDTYYCQFRDWTWTPINEPIDYWALSLTVEELV